MVKFISIGPYGKLASCLGFRKHLVKELPGILKHYNENISGNKTYLLMRTCVVFCSFQSKIVSTVVIGFVSRSYYLLQLHCCFFFCGKMI